MRAFVITLRGHPYSEAKALRCTETAERIGLIAVERFDAIGAGDAREVMSSHGLRWTWNGDLCPHTGLHQHSYGGGDARIGCAMSHFTLWGKCAELGEPILILEHDAVFVREFPAFDFSFACQINDPKGATPRGDWWSERMAARGPGVHPKTVIFPDTRPDGLAGNSAYVLKPRAAELLIDIVHRIGVWPNDATLCRQLFPLEELYPFVTRVEQDMSTTST